MKTTARQSLAAARVLLLFMLLGSCTGAAPDGDSPPGSAPASRGESVPFNGYTLFNPLRSTSVYLVDMDGAPVHRWKTAYNTGQSVYLLDNGNLLKSVKDPNPAGVFGGGGEGGIVQEIAPDGTVVWEFKFSDEKRRHHHDIAPMPNGNVLLIAWEGKTYDEALQAGINPARMDDDDIWHDARWIPAGYPGAGNITVFNNGRGRPDPAWSSVDEIVPPMNADGSYTMEPLEPTAPAAPIWSYIADEKSDFYNSFISGAHRLPNGNTIVGAGAVAKIFEVGADNAIVWEMDNPFVEDEGPQAEAADAETRMNAPAGISQ